VNLALFDFDHTLTRRDSLLDFTRFAVGTGRLWAGLAALVPAAAGFGLGRISNSEFKRRFLTRFFGGWPMERFRATAERYARERLPAILNPRAVGRLRWHLAQGDAVYVVTASASDWIADWARGQGVSLIASQLEVRDNRLTGCLLGANCHGPEKAARIREVLNLADYQTIHAYGDSRGDREMLALAHQPHFREF